MQSCNAPHYGAFRTARSLYRLTNRALAQIKELWQYAGEDELPSESLLHAQVEALRILHIDVPLSAKRQFQLFAQNISQASPISSTASLPINSGLSSRCMSCSPIVTNLMPKAPPSVFGGLGRRYVLVAFDDCPLGLLSHADGSGLLPEARPIRLALILDIGSN